MASLKQIVKEYRTEIVDGIAWIVIWKKGRSWNAAAFWPEDGSYDDGYTFDRYDLEAMKMISFLDFKAVCFNGYYFGEDFTNDEIADRILYFYEMRRVQLKGDFLDCWVIQD